jgi:hypothetical protein
MSKVLHFAGVSRVAGELKFRTATEPSRFQQLTKLGDTDVEMTKIAPALSKQAAAQELLTRNFANGRAEIQALLESVAGKTSAPRKSGTMRVKKSKVDNEKKLSIAEANARVMATMREITPEEAIKYLVHAMPRKRRGRRTQVEVA